MLNIAVSLLSTNVTVFPSPSKLANKVCRHVFATFPFIAFRNSSSVVVLPSSRVVISSLLGQTVRKIISHRIKPKPKILQFDAKKRLITSIKTKRERGRYQFLFQNFMTEGTPITFIGKKKREPKEIRIKILKKIIISLGFK